MLHCATLCYYICYLTSVNNCHEILTNICYSYLCHQFSFLLELFNVSNISALRSKMKQKALKECDRYTAKYAECASGRTLSIVWQCRRQAKELNECLHQ